MTTLRLPTRRDPLSLAGILPRPRSPALVERQGWAFFSPTTAALFALLSVNLNQAKITDKHEDTKQATIVLPEPVVLQPRVDHSHTRTWSVDHVAWLPWNADQDALRDAVYAEGQQLVAHTAASAENLTQAKLTAETMLKALYAEVGWQVTVTWADLPSEGQKAAAAKCRQWQG